MKFILKKWKKNSKHLNIIFIGMIISILSISIGSSFIKDSVDFSMEMQDGNNEVHEQLLYNKIKNENEPNINKYLKELNDIVIELNKDYEVCLGTIMYPFDRNIPLSDVPSISPNMNNKVCKWKPNLIYGRYLTDEESLSNKKIAVIGYELYNKIFKNEKFDDNKYINIFGQNYRIVGVVGRVKRYCKQNNSIQVPYKNYFEFYKEEGDINNLLISISGKKPFDLHKFEYNGLTKVNQPTYKNDIKIPLKLILTIGFFLLLTTVINESNLFSLWIINQRKEIAIKKALGATDFIIIKNTLLETFLISAISTIIALIIQYFIQNKLNILLIDYELRITWINYVMALIISFIVSILASIVPARIILAIHSSSELK